MLDEKSPEAPPSPHKGNGTVIQPSTIGHNVLIENAIVGPYVSLSDGVQVVGVEIRESIILSGTKISGRGAISHSIIGGNCDLELFQEKNAYRFILGDDCSMSGL